MAEGEVVIAYILFAVLAAGYIWAGRKTSAISRLRRWPLRRYLFWVAGLVCVFAVFTPTAAAYFHRDFIGHMQGHLLLGMLGPLLLVLAAPVTLVLRTLPVRQARFISAVLKSGYLRFISHPVTASVLNIGGLWLLYTTSLFSLMHHYPFVNFLIHLHVFLAGYLFTVSLIYIDPAAHRHSFRYRLIVFIFALAGHGILSKYIYAYPPAGVPRAEAETGGMLMYYGGDAVDIFIIFILCLQWYRHATPKQAEPSHVSEKM